MRPALLLALAILPPLAGCTGCVFEGTTHFEVSVTSYSRGDAQQVTVFVLRDGQTVAHAAVNATPQYQTVGSFHDKGHYVVRASSASDSGEVEFDYARCGGTAGVSVSVDEKGAIHMGRAVV